MPADIGQMMSDALALEQAGDLQGALNIWYSLEGQTPLVSMSKDGMQMTFSDSQLAAKISRLEKRIANAAGAGKLRRIPTEHVPQPAGDSNVVYDADGYAWGY